MATLTFALLSSGLTCPATAAATHSPEIPMNATSEAATKSNVEDLLRIQIEPTITDAALFPQWIRDRNPDLAQQLPVESAHDYWILVEIWGTTYDYHAHVTVIRDSDPVEPNREDITCDCNSETLLGLVDREIAEVVEHLSTASPDGREQIGPEATITNQDPEPVPIAEPAPSDVRRRLRPLGYAGTGLAILGAGALATGIPLALRPDIYDERNSMPGIRSTRLPGIALASVGGIVLTTGIALLAIDLIRSRDRTMTIVPEASPRLVRLSLRLRI